jgi:hypothetical protein
MRAALPGWIRLIDESYVGLVNKRGWLQCVPLVFFAQVGGGKLAEFAVHQGREVIESSLITLRPFSQE